jgi:hypothetical protein
MLKKSLFLALSLMLVFSLSAFAGEGSDTVGGGKLLPQLRYDFTANDWETHSFGAGAFTDWDFGAHNYYVQANWGILNNADLILLVGGRSLRMETEDLGWHGNADTGPALLLGLGAKVTFFRADNGFYTGGGVLFTASFDNDFTFSQYTNTGAPAGEYDFDYSVYSIVPELHVGYHFKNIALTPYIGVDAILAEATTESDDGGVLGRNIVWHPENPVYMFAGIDYYLNDRLYINVEGRTNFTDGWGIGTGVGYLFDICAKPAPPVVEPAPPIEPKLEPMSKN